MMRLQDKLVHRLSRNAILLTAALVLSYIEAILPLGLIVPLPGVKLGLCNIAIMLAFYRGSRLDALCISLLRVFISALLFGSAVSLAYSLSGALLAYLTMLALSSIAPRALGRVGVSCACAAAHNIGQIFAASLILGSAKIFYYLPTLLVASVPLGILTGIILILLEAKLPKKL